MPSNPDDEFLVYDAPGDALLFGRDKDQIAQELRWLQARSKRRYDEAPPPLRAITWGEYFVRDWTDPYSKAALRIYGRVETLAELHATEDPHVVQSLIAQYALGFRYGRHYSTREPTGEWGSTHVADMAHRISEAEFLAARTRGWR